MHKIIGSNAELHKMFGDFFFISKAIGLKMPFKTSEFGLWPTYCQDLDWSKINEKDTLIDIGFEYHYLGIVPITLLWRTTDLLKIIKHEEIIQHFWGNDAKLCKSKYRLHTFMHSRNLGGFQYEASPKAQPKIPGIVKMIAYHKIKQPFYDCKPNSDRYGVDLNPDHLFNNSKAFHNYLVCIK